MAVKPGTVAPAKRWAAGAALVALTAVLAVVLTRVTDNLPHLGHDYASWQQQAYAHLWQFLLW